MTDKDKILLFLKDKPFTWGGVVEDYLRASGTKGGTVSRRCRELVDEGKLLVIYEQVNGKGPKCVKYAVNTMQNMGLKLRMTV